MASYSDKVVNLGTKTTSGATVTFTYSASDINNAINSAGIPSDCKVSRVVVVFRGAKSSSWFTDGDADITMSISGYSKTHKDVVANNGTNDNFSSDDVVCSSDNIKGYLQSNGRFSHNLSFSMSKGASSTYWRCEASLRIDYVTYSTITVGVNNSAGGYVSPTGGSYYTGETFSVSATPYSGYVFSGWGDANGNITTTANPYSFTVGNNTTFYAIFKGITYHVEYDGNGATSGSTSKSTHTYGTSSTLTANGFSRAGCAFLGWSADKYAKQATYSNQQSISTLTTTNGATIKLYAVWYITPDIGYDNLFSLSKWTNSTSGRLPEGVQASMIINNEEGSIRITENNGSNKDIYTLYGGAAEYFHVQVSSNTNYHIHLNMEQKKSGSLGQFFVFFYNSNGDAASVSHQGWREKDPQGNPTLNSTKEYILSFTTPSNCTKIGMRFGIYNIGADVVFSNIRIYKDTGENGTYQRIIKKINYKTRDLRTLSKLYTPTKEGYTFNNWYQYENLTSPVNLAWAQQIETGSPVYSKWTEHKYTINFNGGLGTVTGTTNSIQNVLYDTEVKLTKNGFKRAGYKFLGWSTDPNHGSASWNDEAIVSGLAGKASDNDVITLYAIWERLKYTIKWKNIDGKGGSRLQENVEGGTWPSCPYEVKKDYNETYHYHFNNKWTPVLQTVDGDPLNIIEYEAIFDEEGHKFHTEVIQPSGNYQGYDLHSCTVDSVCAYSYKDNYKWGITFKNGDEDGAEEYIKITPGKKPTYTQIPTKRPEERIVYIFDEENPWTPPIITSPTDNPHEKGNMVYTPNFKAETRYYKITFLKMNEEVQEIYYLEYEEKIIPPEPLYEETSEFYFEFLGWQRIDNGSNEVITNWDEYVFSNAVYKAVYKEQRRKYQVEWWENEERLLGITEVEYGSSPKYPDTWAKPEKPSDNENIYVFAGWDDKSDDLDAFPEDTQLPDVIGPTKYVAHFAPKDRYYKIRWVNESLEEGKEGRLYYEEGILFGVSPRFNVEKYGTPIHPILENDIDGIFEEEQLAYEFTFIGWKTKINDTPVENDGIRFEGEITYIAAYSKIPKYYETKINRFYGDEYGPTEIYLTRYGEWLYPDAMLNDVFGFNFIRWEKQPENGNREFFSDKQKANIRVTGNAEYWAIYEGIECSVRWLDYDRTVLKLEKRNYRDKPLENITHASPSRERDNKYHYSFSGWFLQQGRATSEGEILGDVTYIARYARHNHIWSNAQYTYKDDGTQCTAHRYCNVNGEYHDQSRTIKTIPTIKDGDDATCTEKGYTTYIANFYDDWNRPGPLEPLRLEDINPKGHDYAPATSLGNNIKDYILDGEVYNTQHYIYCKRCNLNYTQDHNWEPEDTGGLITSYAACLVGGKKKIRCQTYGCKGFYEIEILPEGHKLQEKEQIDSTCTKIGYEQHQQCNVCGLYFSQNDNKWSYGHYKNPYIISPLGHNYEIDTDKTKKANCVEYGVAVEACTRHCGEPGEKIETIIPPRGHDWTWQSTITFPTCTQEGEDIYYCQNTNDNKETALYKKCEYDPKKVIIPKEPHQPKIEKGEKPTCTKDGLTDGSVCKICNTELIPQRILPALGHKYIAKSLVPAENTLRREIRYGCTRKGCTHHYNIQFVK